MAKARIKKPINPIEDFRIITLRGVVKNFLNNPHSVENILSIMDMGRKIWIPGIELPYDYVRNVVNEECKKFKK